MRDVIYEALSNGLFQILLTIGMFMNMSGKFTSKYGLDIILFWDSMIEM